MDLDGYRLYEQLKHGDPVWITHKATRYQLQFVGEPVGTNNYLLMTDGNRENRYGWGWGSEQVWRALDHLARGLDKSQVPRYKVYNEQTEVER